MDRPTGSHCLLHSYTLDFKAGIKMEWWWWWWVDYGVEGGGMECVCVCGGGL